MPLLVILLKLTNLQKSLNRITVNIHHPMPLVFFLDNFYLIPGTLRNHLGHYLATIGVNLSFNFPF